ncbi:M20/M25/M40 family metallo-hydrolase [Thermus tengchongensis]|uniref:M20/M25/M40 family metallo-hydrolase n=1 Tax=Thermus tengchongensis TaxID=1214928 RepID=A0ABY2KDN9_9DEIN|nr:M20/M25/M40 family metallo-hydrolase [Thermus tengchongensis]TFU18009.1 M20/M25/M40 family metallo-hydrolase [Thermus tengchongensis]
MRSFLEEARALLAELVALPTVSAEGKALEEGAAKVAEVLRDLGLEAELHRGYGPPVVYAEGGEGERVLLFYNHYDVQPPDPLESWESEPFRLEERNGAWYGRGAHDDKGELVARIMALRLFREKHGFLPRVKFVVEGEEEVGSPHLADYVRDKKDLLKSGAIVWEAGGVDAKGRPYLYAGLKGIVALELRVRTAAFDLHSSYGAVVENPIYRLSRAISSLRDEEGRVLIPGFYDRVRPLSPTEMEVLAEIPDESEALREAFGVRDFLGGARNLEFNQRLYAEPCVNINGFHSGYGGPGSKTVLPAEAFAKLDFRLVPDQDPEEIPGLLKRHLEAQGFHDVEVVVLEKGEHPARSDLTHPFVGLARRALEEAFGQKAVVYPNMAGSGPMHPFLHHLKAPAVGLGVGYPGSRVHSPNEHIRIQDFERGTLALLRLLELYFLGR